MRLQLRQDIGDLAKAAELVDLGGKILFRNEELRGSGAHWAMKSMHQSDLHTYWEDQLCEQREATGVRQTK